MFHHFSQNNSGGRFYTNHARGISHHVVIEGHDREDIIARAHNLGLYFNGCADGRDCSCCGDRWYKPWGGSTDFSDVPKIYDVDVSSGVYTDSFGIKWIEDGPEGYVHYMNGTVQPVTYTKKTKMARKTKTAPTKKTKKTKTARKAK